MVLESAFCQQPPLLWGPNGSAAESSRTPLPGSVQRGKHPRAGQSTGAGGNRSAAASGVAPRHTSPAQPSEPPDGSQHRRIQPRPWGKKSATVPGARLLSCKRLWCGSSAADFKGQSSRQNHGSKKKVSSWFRPAG